MCTKNTRELEEILENTHTGTYDQYCRTYEDSLLPSLNPFGVYLKECLKNNHITQQQAFLQAQIPEGYGYKLLSGEKKTRQRDVILRICYAGKLTLAQTQQALKKYEMPQLYAKIPRDALLMICFNDRPGSIIQVNEQLCRYQFEPLKSSGMQDEAV